MSEVPEEIIIIYGKRRQGMSNRVLQIAAKVFNESLEDKLFLEPRKGDFPIWDDKKDNKK